MGRRMGRTPIFADPEIRSDFLKAIKLGLSIEKACEYAGVNELTFYNYQNKAEEDEKAGKKDTVYIKFIKEFKKARSACVIKHVLNISEASERGSWQASAWLLERRFSKDFAVKQEVNVDLQPIKIVNDVPIPQEED